MKVILSTLAFLILTSTAVPAQTMNTEEIQAALSDANVGSPVQVSQALGQYLGTCFSPRSTSQEALFVGNFEVADGGNQDLLISTLLTYGGESLPESLSFLLTSSNESEAFITNFVRNGFTGTDNNFGSIGHGADFKWLYQSKTVGSKTVVTQTKKQICISGICNPPILTSCDNYRVNGVSRFEGCTRENDETAFKALEDGTILSHRTAKAVGQRINNFSFYLEPVSTYCQWTKI